MLNSGFQKPPVAPKPTVVQPPKPGLSPATPRRAALSVPSPATERKLKPDLAPKPCHSKVTTSAGSPNPTKKQTPRPDSSLSVGLLNSQNGLQKEKKRPNWDYIIPICLCSNENCLCIKNETFAKIEKELKIQKTSKAETEQRKAVSENIVANVEPKLPISEYTTQNDSAENGLNDNVIKNHKPFQEVLALYQNLNTMNSTYSPALTNSPSVPHKQCPKKAKPNVIIPQTAPGKRPEENDLGSAQISSLSNTNVIPAAPRKHVPVSVPRKPWTSGLAKQEKVEEEIVDQKVSEVSSEVRSSLSLSVNVPASALPENTPAHIPKPTYAPPAPLPRKRPFLSELSKSFSSEDVVEEDLGWDVHAMEVLVDKEDDGLEKDRKSIEEPIYSAVYSPSHSPCSSPVQPPKEEVVVKVAPQKPQRRNSPMARMQSMESIDEKDNETPERNEEREILPSPDTKEVAMRELPLPPDDKITRNAAGTIKSSRSSLSKAKSFSGVDASRPQKFRKNSFKSLLKLAVKKRLKASGSQSHESSDSEKEHCEDEAQSALQQYKGARKFSCPLIGLNPQVEPEDDYEDIAVYEEIEDYMNVKVGEEATSPWETEDWPSPTSNDDEDFYELQEPYMTLDKNIPPPQEHYDYPRLSEATCGPKTYDCPTSKARFVPCNPEKREPPSAISCNSKEAKTLPLSKKTWASSEVSSEERASDEEILANTTDEEDDEEEDDTSSVSSKGGDPELTESATLKRRKSKIQHIATEIMTSENVFVDVLKLLHVDFRNAVYEASSQSGKPVIEDRLLDQILYYLPQLYELNQELLKELRQRVATWGDNSKVADIFVKKGAFLKMYSNYIREFDKNVALLDEQTKKNAAFGAVVREFEASPCCANLALKHYLLKPVQRIPQYQLLLTDYLKNLPDDSSDYKDTQEALVIVKEVANHANDIMKQGDNFQKLIQVQCRLIGQHEIIQPGRIFLKEGVVDKLSRKNRQPRMIFLFNDMLLYTLPVQTGQFKVKHKLSLAGMKIKKPPQEAFQNELIIESVERSFIFSVSSPTERDKWLEAISTAISDYTKKKTTFIPGKPDEVDIESGATLGTKAPIWIPDLRATMCMICTFEFTLTWRRHHCRACGKVVCQSCSSNKYRLKYLKNQLARVCDECFVVLQKQKNEKAISCAVGNKTTFAFNRKHKIIPAHLKEVSANTANSTMSGYLERIKPNKKQGKRLWFVIKGMVLYTYAASEDVAALKSQPLLGLSVKSDSTLQFRLTHKDKLFYIFKAEDEQTSQRWIEAIKEASVLQC